MGKWIIYWSMYMTNVDTVQISGYILIANDSISYYTIEDGYQTIPITYSTYGKDEKSNLHSGMFIAKKDDRLVTFFIDYSYINIEYRKRRIRLKRKHL